MASSVLRDILRGEGGGREECLCFEGFSKGLRFGKSFVDVTRSRCNGVVLRGLGLPFGGGYFIADLVRRVARRFKGLCGHAFHLPHVGVCRYISVVRHVRGGVQICLVLRVLRFKLRTLIFRFLRRFFVTGELRRGFGNCVGSCRGGNGRGVGGVTGYSEEVEGQGEFGRDLQALGLFRKVFRLIQ